MLVSGAAEVFTLASIIPFLAILNDPDFIWKIDIVRQLSQFFGVSSSSELLLPFTVIFVISAVLASFIRILNLWFSGRIAAAIGTDLSCMTYSKLLYQPYHIHVKSNSSKAIAVSTTHVQNTVVVVNLALQLTISAVIAIFILSALIIADIFLSICLILLFGSVYLLLAFLEKKRLVSNSRSVAESQQLQVKSL